MAQKILSLLYNYPLIGMSTTFLLGVLAGYKYLENKLPQGLVQESAKAKQADTADLYEHKAK